MKKSLFAIFFLSLGTSVFAQKLKLNELHCVLDNGVEIHSKNTASKTNRIEVETEFFGFTKTFDAELIMFNSQGFLKSVITLRPRDFMTPHYTLTIKLEPHFNQIQHTKYGEITNGLTLNRIVECTTEIVEY